MPDGDIDIEQSALADLAARYAEGIAKPVFWVGAGLSAPAELPTWVGLRDRLIKAARKKASSMDKTVGDAIRNEISQLLLKDYWSAFDHLHDILQPASYTAEIRAALSAANSASVPEIYKAIWELKIDGIVTLNLDRFASKAFAETRKSIPIEFTGQECGRFHHVLRSNRPFVVNMHGIHDDVESWVFRLREIRALQSKSEYKSFTSNLFGSKTIVFVGLSAEDRAAGGFLEKLASQGIDFGGHFWITNRKDANTDAWAERAGIRVIRYDAATNEDHTARLLDIIQHLARAHSKDNTPQPVVPSSTPALCVLTPTELAKEDPETIRLHLNAEAARILRTDTPPYNMFSHFCEEYKRPIFYSWHVDTKAGENEFFGYKILEEVGAGAFGTVYRAEGKDGKPVAVKILRQEVRSDERMLGSFRRGVSSMRILADRNVNGMVPYREAFELPPSVIMEFVDGDTLERAIESNIVTNIDDILDVACKTAAIIRSGHLLPERVLHRDIRPSNIMIRDLYTDDENKLEVVVLDFDLSWHKNALERSISSHATSALGYLAPEQLSKSSGVSTRHTAVDSYGLAMTLYFMLAQQHPVAGDSQSAEWFDKVSKRVRQKHCPQWQSLTNRVARLICSATNKDQSKRPEFGSLYADLETLLQVCRHPEEEGSADLWAEEVFVRAMPHKTYSWDQSTRSVSTDFVSGVRFIITPNEAKGHLELSLTYQSQGNETYKSVGKYLPPAIDQLLARLRSGAWEVTTCNRSHNSAAIRAKISIEALQTVALSAVAAIAGVDQLFDFK